MQTIFLKSLPGNLTKQFSKKVCNGSFATAVGTCCHPFAGPFTVLAILISLMSSLTLRAFGASMEYEQWVKTFGLVGASAEFDADPDGDGLSNGAEFAGGSNPCDPLDAARAVPSVDEMGRFQIILPRNPDAVGIVRIFECSDLQSDWTTKGLQVVELNATSLKIWFEDQPARSFVRVRVLRTSPPSPPPPNIDHFQLASGGGPSIRMGSLILNGKPIWSSGDRGLYKLEFKFVEGHMALASVTKYDPWANHMELTLLRTSNFSPLTVLIGVDEIGVMSWGGDGALPWDDPHVSQFVSWLNNVGGQSLVGQLRYRSPVGLVFINGQLVNQVVGPAESNATLAFEYVATAGNEVSGGVFNPNQPGPVAPNTIRLLSTGGPTGGSAIILDGKTVFEGLGGHGAILGTLKRGLVAMVFAIYDGQMVAIDSIQKDTWAYPESYQDIERWVERWHDTSFPVVLAMVAVDDASARDWYTAQFRPGAGEPIERLGVLGIPIKELKYRSPFAFMALLNDLTNPLVSKIATEGAFIDVTNTIDYLQVFPAGSITLSQARSNVLVHSNAVRAVLIESLLNKALDQMSSDILGKETVRTPLDRTLLRAVEVASGSLATHPQHLISALGQITDDPVSVYQAVGRAASNSFPFVAETMRLLQSGDPNFDLSSLLGQVLLQDFADHLLARSLTPAQRSPAFTFYWTLEELVGPQFTALVSSPGGNTGAIQVGSNSDPGSPIAETSTLLSPDAMPDSACDPAEFEYFAKFWIPNVRLPSDPDEVKGTPEARALFEHPLKVNDSAGFGYTVDAIFDDPATGFAAVGLKSATKGSLLVVRGTTFKSPKDLIADLANLSVGRRQFDANLDRVRDWVREASKTGLVSFTGHSLGGALTQLFVAVFSREFKLGGVVTFNSPGIEREMAALFNPANVVEVNHYLSFGDIYAMSGEARIEGVFNWVTYSNRPWIDLDAHTFPIFYENLGGTERPAGVAIERVTSKVKNQFLSQSPIPHLVTLMVEGARLKAGDLSTPSLELLDKLANANSGSDLATTVVTHYAGDWVRDMLRNNLGDDEFSKILTPIVVDATEKLAQKLATDMLRESGLQEILDQGTENAFGTISFAGNATSYSSLWDQSASYVNLVAIGAKLLIDTPSNDFELTLTSVVIVPGNPVLSVIATGINTLFNRQAQKRAASHQQALWGQARDQAVVKTVQAYADYWLEPGSPELSRVHQVADDAISQMSDLKFDRGGDLQQATMLALRDGLLDHLLNFKWVVPLGEDLLTLYHEGPQEEGYIIGQHLVFGAIRSAMDRSVEQLVGEGTSGGDLFTHYLYQSNQPVEGSLLDETKFLSDLFNARLLVSRLKKVSNDNP